MTLETCHQRCQNDAACEYFSLDLVSDPKVCSLYYGACTESDAPVANTKLYAKTGFYEEPAKYVVDSPLCTHFSKWNNEPKWVSYCKEQTTFKTCLNIDVYDHQNGRSVAYASGIDCEGGTNIHSVAETKTQAECATICHEKYADFFTLSTDAGTIGHCACYTGLCAATGSAATFDVYSVENICYWTKPLLVHENSDCANSAQATVNGGLDLAVTTVTYAADWDLALCHYQCQEQSSKYFANTMFSITSPDCLGFSIDSATGNCNLYYNGVCTKSATDAKPTHTYYAISGFLEIPFITTDTCTHLHEYEEDAIKVAACKEHTTLATCKSQKDSGGVLNNCYYLKYDQFECGGTELGVEIVDAVIL
jgi:hypothetical protein